MIKCYKCKAHVLQFGYDKNKRKYCYSCCGKFDEEVMQKYGKIDLYYCNNTISNWPGTLKIVPTKVTVGYHNICRTVTYVYFKFNNENWTGKNLGNNDILRCKRVKR